MQIRSLTVSAITVPLRTSMFWRGAVLYREDKFSSSLPLSLPTPTRGPIRSARFSMNGIPMKGA
jgi:hypothetical protein